MKTIDLGHSECSREGTEGVGRESTVECVGGLGHFGVESSPDGEIVHCEKKK